MHSAAHADDTMYGYFLTSCKLQTSTEISIHNCKDVVADAKIYGNLHLCFSQQNVNLGGKLENSDVEQHGTFHVFLVCTDVNYFHI